MPDVSILERGMHRGGQTATAMDLSSTVDHKAVGQYLHTLPCLCYGLEQQWASKPPVHMSLP